MAYALAYSLCLQKGGSKLNIVLMETLTNTSLFFLLTAYVNGTSPAVEELCTAYEEYRNLLADYNRSCISVSEKLRQLFYARIELVSLKQLSAGTGQVADIYLDKCLSLVEAEIELVNFCVAHPQTNESSASFLSSLHWKGTLVNLMELISSLDYSELVTDESGKRLSFAGIVSAFEKLFNVSIPKPYDLRADLARRKKNYSVLLPKLKEAYERNIAACGNGK